MYLAPHPKRYPKLMKSSFEKLADIEGDDSGEIDDIEEIYDLVDLFFEENSPLDSKDIRVLISLFEKFPVDYYSHVFWNILHGLEHVGGYESELLASLERKPSCMVITMLGRMINSDIIRHSGVSIIDEIKKIANNSSIHADISERASSVI